MGSKLITALIRTYKTRRVFSKHEKLSKIANYFAKSINDLPDHSLSCKRNVIRISKNYKAALSLALP